MQVRSYKLRDRTYNNWFTEIEHHWDYENFLENDEWRKDWISFDCLCYDDKVKKLFAGVTSFNASDIFWSFDIEEKRFVPTGYERIADPFDGKFHRSLEKYEKDGCLYAAVALLHDVDNYLNAPGGAIVKYSPVTGELIKLSIPLPHMYIQSTIIDQDRGILYGQTFTPEKLFSYNLNSGEVKDLGPLGSGMQMAQGENIALDDRGCVWGAWGISRAWQDSPGPDSMRLFCFNPDLGRIEYLKIGLPKRDGSYGFEKAEAFFNLGTGCLYASGGNGSLYRIDPVKRKVEYIGTPISERPSRLAALALAGAGKAYGITGREGETELLCFDPGREIYELLGSIQDGDGNRPYQIHHIAAVNDNVLYAGENDNPYRSGYLWEISIKE